eukprot:gene35258-45658_t
MKDSALGLSLWTENEKLEVTRELRFFKPVNLPGLASTSGLKTQTIRRFADAGLLLRSSTRLKDVPAADAFTVDDLLAVRALSSNRIQVDISFQVSFSKSTLLRLLIESSTNREMAAWLRGFFLHIKKVVNERKEAAVAEEADTSCSSAPPE